MKEAKARRCPALVLFLCLLLPPLPSRADFYPLPGSPLQIRSMEKDGLVIAEIEGPIDSPFDRASGSLTRPESWCEFLPLVFNVQSCTSSGGEGGSRMTLGIGRRFSDPPQEAIPLTYLFRVKAREKGRFQVLLSAPEGPFATRDYRIELEASPAADGGTLLRMRSSFRPSLRSKLATRTYLATSGRDKVGFSVLGRGEGGPVYAGGMKGVIERNAMRYYLALQAHLDTLHLPEKSRFEARLRAWHASTERYPKQLREVDRQTYLDVKRQEREYQLQLQKKLG